MHSLFLRIFVLFWIAMALIVGGSIAITFSVAAREYESPEYLRRPNVAIQASEVLATGGISALRKWLQANEHPIPDRDLFIIGPDGRDILGRRLSDSAARRLEFFNRESTAAFGPPGTEPREAGPPGGTPPGVGAPPWEGRRPAIFVRNAPLRRSWVRMVRPTRCCSCRGARAFSAP